MSDIAIKVEDVGKLYRLGEVGTGTLSQDLKRWWAVTRGNEDPFAKIGETNDRTTKGESDFVWALKNINFEVKQGEVLGIIGRNGAGKSTLLKLLSKVTQPTTGNIKIKGRIASLLEVGTGFHPDLTGRENVFLNGAILGMTKREIKSKFDEIVDFAGVERYIDTPVKRYSSGMYVRLAFAVAAFLEPEILIIDEVLAVGDAEFQKKCLGRMHDVSVNDGRTVLFVSHNMAAVNQLCDRTIFMKQGKIEQIGSTAKIVTKYLNYSGITEAYVNLANVKDNRTGNRKVEFKEIFLTKENNSDFERIFSLGDSIQINFSIKFSNPNQKKVKTAIELKTSEGMKLANMIDVDSGFQVEYNGLDVTQYKVVLKDIRLYPDTYYLSFFAGDMSSSEAYDYLEDCISFEVIDGGELTTRNLPRTAGLLFLTPEWKLTQLV
jgi:lipopolysaccharide transport system ATP-binding protein